MGLAFRPVVLAYKKQNTNKSPTSQKLFFPYVSLIACLLTTQSGLVCIFETFDAQCLGQRLLSQGQGWSEEERRMELRAPT